MKRSCHSRWMCLIGIGIVCFLITITHGFARTAGGMVAPADSFPPEPIALGWKIAMIAVVVSALGTGLYFSARRWRSSNLFDRQYRFAPVAQVALRLGGTKSGGSMATIVFVDRAANAESLKIRKPEETPPR